MCRYNALTSVVKKEMGHLAAAWKGTVFCPEVP